MPDRVDKIGVLLLLYSFEPGGAERVALTIACHLDRDRFRPVVCAFKSGPLRIEFEKIDVPAYTLNKRKKLDLRVVGKLARICREERIEIIHSHNFSPNLWGRIVARTARVRASIVTEHTVATAKTVIQKRLDRILASATYRIIAVSEKVKMTHLEEERLPENKIVTIYNGVEPFDPEIETGERDALFYYRTLGISEGDAIITTVGRLETMKGHRFLIEASASVLKTIPRATLLIIGNGSLKDELESKARALGIGDHVVFTGFRNDVRNILALSNIFILPSIREGFSLSLLEAMSVGKPIVATDVGGNSEAILDGDSGLIVPSGNPGALAAGIIRFLADPIFAREAGEKAKKRFDDHFHVRHMVKAHESLYEEAVRAAGKGRKNLGERRKDGGTISI